MKRVVLIQILFVLWAIPSFANSLSIKTTNDGQSDQVVLSGKVLDAKNKAPLFFASISLRGGEISNVSNGEGVFLLKISDNYLMDTVSISFLGYQTAKCLARDLIQNGKTNYVYLLPSALEIPAATVKWYDANVLVKESLSKIKDNYPNRSMQMTAFYREMIKKKSTYVTLTEAVLDILKSPYANDFSSDQIGIFKGRGSVDRSRIDTIFVKFRGGINASLELDVMKYPFLTADPYEIDDLYLFSFDSPIVLNDKVNYVVNFKQKEDNSEILFRGKIYIDLASLAITRVDFNMNVEENDDATNIFIRKKPIGLKVKILYAKYLVQYKEYDGKWTFDYSRTELKFDSKWSRRLFKTTHTVISEVAVTERSNKVVKIPTENRVRPKDVTLDKVADFSDDNFWKDYNVIEPESGIESIIQRIVKQLKRSR